MKSATFFTTLTDFSDPGEVGVFLGNDFVDGIERQSREDGMLSKAFMSRTFSFLRSNDLIYQPAIKSYMLGEAPPAFDLLYWNGDGTNLPCNMALEYLRGLCQQDGFAKGTFKVFGHQVSLADVKLPLCAIACETDHIAPWKASFNGIRQMGSKDKTFILSQSGHIAGIVNPPSKGKYGHYTNDGPMAAAGGLAERRDIHAGQLVAALEGLAGGTVGRPDRGARTGQSLGPHPAPMWWRGRKSDGDGQLHFGNPEMQPWPILPIPSGFRFGRASRGDWDRSAIGQSLPEYRLCTIDIAASQKFHLKCCTAACIYLSSESGRRPDQQET